jgi:hypothetical protein
VLHIAIPGTGKKYVQDCVRSQRRERMAFLKIGLENVFRQQSNSSFSALLAGYRLAYILAKKSKPFSSVVRKCLQHLMYENLWKKKLI